MASEWRTATVEDLIRDGVLDIPLDGNHGAIHPKASDFVPEGVPFIMASDLIGGRVDLNGCAFITEKQASGLRKGFAKAGDILLSHKATIGRTAILQQSEHPYVVLTPQVTYYRVRNPKRLNPRFLKYYFDSEGFQQVLGSWAGSGSTRAYLGITAQRKLPILLPPISIQDEIVSSMGVLDDKIAILRETNTTLEAIAQAIFKSWFMDFDPVRAKSEGRDPEGVPPEVVDLFPREFEDSELGEIPKGWRVGRFSQLADLHKQARHPQEEPETVFEHYSLPAFDSGQSPAWESGETIKSNKFTVPKDVVLLSKLNPHIPRVWLTKVVNESAAISSTEFLVLRHKQGVSREWMYLLVRSELVQSALRQLVTGTSNSHQRVKPDNLLELTVVCPPAPVIASFTVQVAPLLERYLANREEAKTMRDLRDTILPRLISGKLRM